MARVTRMGGIKAEAKSSQAREVSAHERTPKARVERLGGVKAKAESFDAKEESAHERTLMARVERLTRREGPGVLAEGNSSV